MSIRVEIGYTNWKGRTSYRTITPRHMYYGKTEFHPDMQWLMVAFDHDKQDDRTFAMKDIFNWRALE